MITQVNLLDCSQEPSDEQLEALMQSVMVGVRAKAKVADAALVRTLKKQAAEVRSRYQLSAQCAVATAA